MSHATPAPWSALAEPQRLLLSVLQSLPDTAVVVIDHDLIVRFTSGRVLERYGWTPDAVVGRPIAEVMGDRFDRYEAAYRGALAGEASTLETADDGMAFRAEFQPLRLDTGVAGAIAIIRDVTESRRGRAALERSEREFRLLAENATDVISRHALDGTYLYASPALTRLLGWHPDEIVGRSAFDLIHPADHAPASVAHESLVTGDAPLTIRCRMAHRSGAWVWVETVARRVSDDAVAEIHAATRDLTGQLAMQAAEREAQERFRLAFDEAPIGMALVGLDGSMYRANRALAVILGRSLEEVEGLRFQDVTHPDDLAANLTLMERLLAGEIPNYAMEKRYLARDGSPIWTQLSVSLLRDPADVPIALIAQVQDIRERKRLQEELQHLADHDPLSGLWNRRRFEEELRHAEALARRQGPTAALLLFDLDDLKRVNDTFGHQGGDELIRAVAAGVRDALRETDAVARLGGDEFAVLVPGVDAPGALAVANKVRETIKALDVTIAGQVIRGTGSVGVTMITGAQDVSPLVTADLAMYRAKARGGDRVATG